METWDEAAFERFCSGLVNADFSPVPGSQISRWKGPIRSSLREHSTASRMELLVYPGWPLRYAHVVVEGLRADHAADGLICLWAEDDPAQIDGRNLQALWDRIDEWASVAQGGFREEDRALDAYFLFENRSRFQAELPFGDLVRTGTNGYSAPLFAVKQGAGTLMIEPGSAPPPAADDPPPLAGAFYLRSNIGSPPRNMDDIFAALTNKQTQDLQRALDSRAPNGLLEPSGGYDFIVLAWPRHDKEHDAVVIGFQGARDSLRGYAMPATPNDLLARQRRAGPDIDSLAGRTVLIAGAGSVGGHVAVALASSGVGTIKLHDSDVLKTGNLVRHVGREYAVGHQKTTAVQVEIESHAPWTTVQAYDDLPFDPTGLSARLEGVDLVVDCTGNFAVTAAAAEMCRRSGTGFISGAMYHQGAMARIQRQSTGDTPIATRHADPMYWDLPPEDPSLPNSGFLELGCTAPINNAPPVAVLSTAAEIASAAVDCLTGRRERPDERIIVFRTLNAPFDRTGTFDPQQHRMSKEL